MQCMGFRLCYSSAIDDAPSECALDSYNFDFVIQNDTTSGLTPALNRAIQEVIASAASFL